MGPLLNEAGALVAKDTEEAEIVNALFASVFTGKTGFQKYQIPEGRGKAWSRLLTLHAGVSGPGCTREC